MKRCTNYLLDTATISSMKMVKIIMSIIKIKTKAMMLQAMIIQLRVLALR